MQQADVPRVAGAVTQLPGHRGKPGEVFTRRWVVELILDLVGYQSQRDLAAMVAVEPSCGTGAFLIPMVERLLASCQSHGRSIGEATSAIRAFDLVDENAATARERAARALVTAGVTVDDAMLLAESWVQADDFLLRSHDFESADFVVGNPPYIRLEHLPESRYKAYRRTCKTMQGRSDIFVGFLELGLRLLKTDGTLGFIVADRWMRNQYGANLRTFVTEHFAVDATIEMHDVNAFDHDVRAYPAVTVLRRGPQDDAIVASTTGDFGERDARRFRNWAANSEAGTFELPSVSAAKIAGWFSGGHSWPTGTPQNLALLADLERRCPPLEDQQTGTRVGIGLATGADDVYITNDPDLVEPERLLPLAMARNLATGQMAWDGTYLVNPWDDSGLVEITRWPRFEAYMERHELRLRGRHTARKSPDRWYRTIDRVSPNLQMRAKLLLPDLKARVHPVLEDGSLYPHHNLYHVTSTTWDLEALGGLILSDIAQLFVKAYSVKMRGGTYRFQAQYLRRIRVPEIESIKAADRRALASAFRDRDVEAATAIAARLYGLHDLPADNLPLDQEVA